MKKILNTSLVTKIIKKINLLCIFFPEMSIYKIYSDKNKCICFKIRDEKKKEKFMIIFRKSSQYNKKIIVNLYI